MSSSISLQVASSPTIGNEATIQTAGTTESADWSQLTSDISDNGPAMAFNTGTTGTGFYDVWPAVPGNANGWFLIQWLHSQNLNPSNMVVNDQSINDPTYGHPVYTFSTPDYEEELNVYDDNGSYYYDMRESGGLFQGAGANLILQTEVTRPGATFNHQIDFSLDAKITEASVGTIPGQNAGLPTVICGLGFTIIFNATNGSNYDDKLPTYTIQFQLPITQTPNVSAFLYPQNYGLQLGAGAASLQNVSGEVVNGEEQLALQADGGPLHHLSYNLNYYLEAMLEQSTYTDPTTGKVAPLPAAFTNLSLWSVQGVYIGTETTNQDPNIVGHASIGLMIGNVNMSVDTNSSIAYMPPMIDNHTPTIIQPSAVTVPTTLYQQAQPVEAPVLISISASNDQLSNIAGSGVPGDVVVLYVGTTTVGAATVSAQGAWKVTDTQTLAEGNNSFTAVQYDVLGNSSTMSAATNFVVAPNAPSITGVNTGLGTTGAIEGNGSPGDVVLLYNGAVTIGAATVTAQGTWNVDVEGTTSSGTEYLTAAQYDPEGNASSKSPVFDFVPTKSSSATRSTLVAQSGQDANGDDQAVAGASTIFGGGGTITFVHQQNPTYVAGGLQAETVLGGAGNFVYQNIGAADTVVSGSGASTINTGAGGGLYFANSGQALIETGPGAATVSAAGSVGCDTVLGGGDSLFFLNSAESWYYGQNIVGTPTVVSGVGAASIFGGQSGGLYFVGNSSAFLGGVGQDTVVGAGELFGGVSFDELVASAANTTLAGGSGGAAMFGSSGSVMIGGSGSDTMVAGSGEQTLFTGSGLLNAWLNNAANNVYIQSGRGNIDCISSHSTFFVNNGQSGGSYNILNFQEGNDQVVADGFTSQQITSALSGQVCSGGSSEMTLPDGTQLTFSGLSSVTSKDLIG